MNKQYDFSKYIFKITVACMKWLVLLFLAGCEADITNSNQDISDNSNDNPANPSTTMPVLFDTITTPRIIMGVDEFRHRWLNSVPCPPPCWERVTPGVTSAAEAEEILNRNSTFTELEMNVIDELDIGYINFRYFWLDDAGTIIECGGDMLFDNTPDNQIIKVIRNTFPPTRLSDLIAYLGEPSHVNAMYDNLRTPYSWIVNIIWMSKGMQMRSEAFSPPPAIDANLELFRVEYFEPGLEGYSQGVGDNWLGNLVEWQGYADFDIYGTSMWEEPPQDSAP